MTVNMQTCLSLSKAVYGGNDATNILSNMSGWTQINLGTADDPVYYDKHQYSGFVGAAYKNNVTGEIVVAFRGTERQGLGEWEGSDALITDPRDFANDAQIVAGQTPSQYDDAWTFYESIRAQYGNNITITGHSLGGGLAQLVAAKALQEYSVVNQTYTFNAPGMLNILDNIGCSNVLNYSFINNYSVMNDWCGMFRAHVGNLYTIPPVELEYNSDPATLLFNLFTNSHEGILNYTESQFGPITNKPVGFNQSEGLSLWYYDVNNKLGRGIDLAGLIASESVQAFTSILNAITIEVSEESLKSAVTIVENMHESLKHTLHYRISSGDYIIGTDQSETGSQSLTGSDPVLNKGGNDTIYGNGGNDILDGLGGADKMLGGAGNDTYMVDDAGDEITEITGEGTDNVKSSISYNLGENLENLFLTGTGNITGSGNSQNNYIYGNDGNNKLNGLAGNDKMFGGKGNDTFVIDSSEDEITEIAGEGTDNVESSISYNLGENLENLFLTGTGNITGAGNSQNNYIYGNDGNNKINGLGGNDVLDGHKGNDTLVGGVGVDKYIVKDKNPFDLATIEDSDGLGQVIYNNYQLAKAVKESENVYKDARGNVFTLAGTTLTITNSAINGNIQINDFQSGDLGIKLLEKQEVINVTVDGKSGPWNIAVNPAYQYGDGAQLMPSIVNAGSGFSINEGDSLNIHYLTGYANAGGWGIWNDANGEEGWSVGQPNESSSGYYVPASDKPIWLETLMGVFAKDGGVIVRVR